MLSLQNLQIGTLQLESPCVQAALSGYSDWPMRVLARRMGAAYTVAEVMLDQFVTTLKNRHRTRRYLMVTDELRPAGAQLMGAIPENFGPAAERLVDEGFDVIDINFGCPVKKALGRCRGGFHLGQPDVAVEIVRQVCAAVGDQLPVTVKLRRGVDDSLESRRRFFDILDRVFDCGVDGVTLHPRTVEQRYRGPSNWDFLAEVKQYVGNRTVIGSGDLFDAVACVKMMESTGVDGVSIARGAIGNPWIFSQVQQLLAGKSEPDLPTLAEQKQVLNEHLDLTLTVYSPTDALRRMRKFGIQYAALHPQHELVKGGFIACRTLDDWQSVMQEFYADPCADISASSVSR